MRLIDADKLLEPGYTDMFDAPIRFAMVSRYAIETAPTIKAIPIEWIKRKAFENPSLSRNLFYRMIIDEWEKEHETN